MPYPTNDSLPTNVKDVLPPKAQEIWRKVFNNAMSPKVGGGSADEDGARKAAWGAIKNAGYVKGPDGKWSKGKALGENLEELLQDAKEGKRLNAAQMKRLKELYGILSEVVKWGEYGDNVDTEKKVKLDQENSNMAEDEKDAVPVVVVDEIQRNPAYGGALSFAEIDEFRKRQKEQWKIQDVFWEFEQLGRNILDNDELSAKDKADKLAELSADLPYRVANPPDSYKTIADKVREGSKAAVTKTEDGQQFSAADYAYVPDPAKPSTWKLRLTETPGKLTVAQVGRAITALQPGGFRGQTVDIPSGDKPGVLSKISGAISKIPGADDTQKSNLTDRLGKVGGKKEMDEEPELGFKVFTDKDGKTRWLGFSSNAFKDDEDEIFKLDALKEAVEYADKTGERGPLQIWHLPHTEIGVCDYQDVIGRILVESGTFLDTDLGQKAEEYFKANEGADFGLSIGYKYEKADREDGVYEWLRIKERSVTAEGAQANPWSQFSVKNIVSEVKSMSDKRKMLVDIYGEEVADKIISRAEETTKMLQDLGVETKSKDGEEGDKKTESVAASEEKKDGEDGEQKTPDLAETIQNLNSRLDLAAIALQRISEGQESLDKSVKELKKSDDEKIANALSSAKSGTKSKAENGEELEEGSEKVEKAKEGLETGGKESPVDGHISDFLRSVGGKADE